MDLSFKNLTQFLYSINDYEIPSSKKDIINSLLYPIVIPPIFTVKHRQPFNALKLLDAEYRKAALVDIANKGRHTLIVTVSFENVNPFLYPINDYTIQSSKKDISSFVYPVLPPIFTVKHRQPFNALKLLDAEYRKAALVDIANKGRHTPIVAVSFENVNPFLYPINDYTVPHGDEDIFTVIYPIIPPTFTVKYSQPFNALKLIETEYRKAALVDIANKGRVLVFVALSFENVKNLLYPINDYSISHNNDGIFMSIYPIIPPTLTIKHRQPFNALKLVETEYRKAAIANV